MKLIFCLQINMKVSYIVVVSLWVCIARHVQSTQYKKFAIFLQYFKENMGDEFDFCQLINMKVSYMLIVSLWVCRAQSTQMTSLQYLKESVKDEVDFLCADKLQRFLQIDTIILGLCGQACPNYPK